eukprot:scaffold1166_cov261-Pinguiococcus_pyrenoidosus.AAC.17
MADFAEQVEAPAAPGEGVADPLEDEAVENEAVNGTATAESSGEQPGGAASLEQAMMDLIGVVAWQARKSARRRKRRRKSTELPIRLVVKTRKLRTMRRSGKTRRTRKSRLWRALKTSLAMAASGRECWRPRAGRCQREACSCGRITWALWKMAPSSTRPAIVRRSLSFNWARVRSSKAGSSASPRWPRGRRPCSGVRRRMPTVTGVTIPRYRPTRRSPLRWSAWVFISISARPRRVPRRPPCSARSATPSGCRRATFAPSPASRSSGPATSECTRWRSELNGTMRCLRSSAATPGGHRTCDPGQGDHGGRCRIASPGRTTQTEVSKGEEGVARADDERTLQCSRITPTGPPNGDIVVSIS